MKKTIYLFAIFVSTINLLNAQCPPNFLNSNQQFNFSENYDVDLADLDGDGDLDAFVSGGNDNSGNYDYVFLNDGNGYFQSNGQSLDQSRIYTSALGDFDGDGDIDAITIKQGKLPTFTIAFDLSEALQFNTVSGTACVATPGPPNVTASFSN